MAKTDDTSKTQKNTPKNNPPWIMKAPPPPNIKFEIAVLCNQYVQQNPGALAPNVLYVPRNRAYDFLYLTYNELGSILDEIMKYGPFDGLKDATFVGMDIKFISSGGKLSVGYEKDPS